MSRVTYHTRTEKIGGVSIFIFGSLLSRGGKPFRQLGDSTGDLESLANIESYVVFHVVSHA